MLNYVEWNFVYFNGPTVQMYLTKEQVVRSQQSYSEVKYK